MSYTVFIFININVVSEIIDDRYLELNKIKFYKCRYIIINHSINAIIIKIDYNLSFVYIYKLFIIYIYIYNFDNMVVWFSLPLKHSQSKLI